MDGPCSRLSDGVFPYLTSALDEENDAAAVGDVCGKFKTYKTYKQTNFFPRRSYRVERIADHSLPNANYLYSPLAIKTCRARGTTGNEG